MFLAILFAGFTSACAQEPANAPATAASMTAPDTASASAGSLNAAPDADPWQFSVAPHMWIAQINGKVKTQRRDMNVGIKFDQIFNHLKGPPLMLYLEARKKNSGSIPCPSI